MLSDTSLPALLGGNPIRPSGPPSWPIPDPEVFAAMQDAYNDGSWGRYHGGNTERLEDVLQDAFSVDHSLVVGSGTFAVELALRGLKISAGDEVIMSAYDYPGNFHCVHAVGAHPVLIDVAAHNRNLNPSLIADAIRPNVKAILVSHLHGGLVPMPEVMQIAGEHGIAVIEDAAQGPGAKVCGKTAGTWGDVGILSFGGSKLLTAGRGGALLTNRDDVRQRVQTFLNRGNHICPLSELQAAVLLPQVKRLPERNAQRLASVQQLANGLADTPGLNLFLNNTEGSTAVYYKVGFLFDETIIGLPRKLFVSALRAEGIALDAGFRGVHVGRSKSRYRQGSALTEADKAHHDVVILHHPVLLADDAALREVSDAVSKIVSYRDRLCETFP